MMMLALCMLLVPAIDLAVKAALRAGIGAGSISLGSLGCVRVRPAQIWLMRARPRLTRRAMWMTWTTAAVAAGAACLVVPALSWPFGLLLGGALSHAVETDLRGEICDPICLRFWPAFDLADVALTAGALGIGLELVGSLR